MPPFQQMPSPRYQPPPQMPTGNGYQIAGQAMQQGGQQIADLGGLFEGMVNDRKKSILEQRKMQIQDEREARSKEIYEKKIADDNELKKRQDAIYDDVGKLPVISESYNGQQKRADIARIMAKHRGIPVDQFLRQHMSVTPEEKNAEWDRRLEGGHKKDMEKINKRNQPLGVRNNTKNIEKRYKGFNQSEQFMLKAVDSNSVPIESQKKNVRFSIEELSSSIQNMIKTISLNENITPEAKAINERRIKSLQDRQLRMEGFLRTLDSWRPLKGGTSHTNSSSSKIEGALKFIRENPNDPRSKIMIDGMRSKGLLDGF